MALADEIANAVATVAGPIVSNSVQRVINEIDSAKEDIMQRLSGKKIQIEITLPDLTKK